MGEWVNGCNRWMGRWVDSTDGCVGRLKDVTYITYMDGVKMYTCIHISMKVDISIWTTSCRGEKYKNPSCGRWVNRGSFRGIYPSLHRSECDEKEWMGAIERSKRRIGKDHVSIKVSEWLRRWFGYVSMCIW